MSNIQYELSREQKFNNALRRLDKEIQAIQREFNRGRINAAALDERKARAFDAYRAATEGNARL